jgi:ketosteroid isomerase-like protein
MRVICCLALLVTAIASTASAQPADPALAARYKEFVAATKGQDPAKVADFFTDDAVIIGASGVRKGRTAVIDSFPLEALKGFARMSSTLVDTRSSGDLGYTFGTYAYPPNGAEKGATGSFMLIWRKVGNQWRIAYDATVSERAPAAK